MHTHSHVHTLSHTQNLPKEVPGILSWSDEDLQELYMSTTRDVVSQINAVKGDWRDVIRYVRGTVQYTVQQCNARLVQYVVQYSAMRDTMQYSATVQCTIQYSNAHHSTLHYSDSAALHSMAHSKVHALNIFCFFV